MKKLIVSFSDLHCASPVGIMPPGQWQLRSANVKQNKGQRLTWKMFCNDADKIGKMRTNAKLIVVLNGDMVEGVHHGNKQVITSYMAEQEAIATGAIDHALQNMKFDDEKGDRLYFVRGTNSHVGESEERIARDFDAVPYRKDSNSENMDGRYCHPSLKMQINGTRIWWAHKLAGVGKGANRENSMRNYMRHLRQDMYAQKITPPDYVIGSHFHQRLYVPDAYRDHEIRGFVLPSYKLKDDYTFEGFSPFGLGDIGMHWISVDDDGSSDWGWLKHEVEQVKEIRE